VAYCPGCGTPLPNDAAFCSTCGRPVGPTAAGPYPVQPPIAPPAVRRPASPQQKAVGIVVACVAVLVAAGIALWVAQPSPQHQRVAAVAQFAQAIVNHDASTVSKFIPSEDSNTNVGRFMQAAYPDYTAHVTSQQWDHDTLTAVGRIDDKYGNSWSGNLTLSPNGDDAVEVDVVNDDSSGDNQNNSVLVRLERESGNWKVVQIKNGDSSSWQDPWREWN
jgi:hypothetical protein